MMLIMTKKQNRFAAPAAAATVEAMIILTKKRRNIARELGGGRYLKLFRARERGGKILTRKAYCFS